MRARRKLYQQLGREPDATADHYPAVDRYDADLGGI